MAPIGSANCACAWRVELSPSLDDRVIKLWTFAC